jgi:hypothetical protein
MSLMELSGFSAISTKTERTLLLNAPSPDGIARSATFIILRPSR